MKKRIFVGIKASTNLQKHIKNWKNKYKDLPVRWINPDNLHITLIPPWYEENIDLVKSKLYLAKESISPFKIRFSKISYGPNERKPRLIWLTSESSASAQLKRKLKKVLGKTGEKRLYKPHMTIARFNPIKFRSFSINRISERVNWKQFVTSYCLYESKLSRKGGQYMVIERIRL